MMRSLFAGVSGLRAHQVRMDVIGNNIANVNTTGYKAARANFADAFSQTVAGATAPGSSRGGMNAKQIGLGVGVSSIDNIMEQGALQLTGKSTDMAISGNGFFVLREGGRYTYTRAGNFDFDAEGFLVNPATGQRVQGWMPDSTGKFPTRDSATMTDIQLPIADSVLAAPTTKVTFDQSLNASSPIPTTYKTAATVIDSLGAEHKIFITFTKSADNIWDVSAADSAGNALTLDDSADSLNYGAGTPQLQFTPSGKLVDGNSGASTTDGFTMLVDDFDPGNGASIMDVTLDFAKVIQPAFKDAAETSTLRALEYDGYPSGALDRITIDNRGVIISYYTNGQYREGGQVAMASFFNPGGLMKESGNNWVESPNSGLALIGEAGKSGRGLIASNNLEMSNVDISAEFTSMIVTQRGFQANSRIITTTDEMLQEVVNLKR